MLDFKENKYDYAWIFVLTCQYLILSKLLVCFNSFKDHNIIHFFA